MKVQCDVCEMAEASVMCCADEAALCRECDTRVHGANKLASKHQRVPLRHLPPEDRPCCDVCQERIGYFFCMEDRALLCRSCDYSVHSVNALAGKHKRFLVAGIKVDLQALSNDDATEVKESQAGSSVAHHVANSAPVSRINHIRSTGVVCVESASRNSSSLETSAHGPDQVNAPGVEKAHEAPKPPTSSLSQSLVLKLSHQEPSMAQVVPSPGLVLPALNSAISHIHFSTEWDMQRHLYSQNSDLGGLERRGDGLVRRSSISEYLTETIPGWRVDDLLSFPDGGETRNDSNCVLPKMGTWDCYEGNGWQFDYGAVEESMPGQGNAEVPLFPSLVPVAARPSRSCGFGKSLKQFDLDSFVNYCNDDDDDDDASVVPDIGGMVRPMSSTFVPSQKRRRSVS